MKWRNGLTASLFALSCSLAANPQDPAVAAGQASFAVRSPEVLEIVASNRSIIEWNEFSIEAGETARFIQPSADSAVLNRVVLANPSRILGRLESNGQILLINPNGILFGQEARIDTGGLIASSLDVNQSLFLAQGEWEFFGSGEGTVENRGSLSASSGDLYLIGPHVVNLGEMAAKNGSAGMIAAHAVLVGGQTAYVRTRWSDSDNPFAGAFHLPEEATYARHEGKIEAPDIWILGDFIALGKSATESSRDAGGGTIHIGGDYQGNNPFVRNSSCVSISPEASIDASARTSGCGGTVIAWGNEANLFQGTILAQGGPLGGDGGFVEVSSLGALDFSGSVSTFAPNGARGILLLDPVTVTISAGANVGIPGVNLPPPPPMVANPYTIPFNAAAATVNIPALLSALTVNDVIIDSSQAGAGTGNITLSSALAITALQTGQLTLNASGAIAINAAITNASATTGIAMTAAGTITTAAAGTIAYTGGPGALSMAGSSVAINGAITLATQSVTTIASTAGDIAVAANIQQTAAATGTDLVILNSAQDVLINGGPLMTSVGSQNSGTAVSAARDIVLQGGTSAVRGAQIGFFTPAAGTSTGPIQVAAGRNLSLSPTRNPGPAQIGHGQINFSALAGVAVATSGADIAVNAGGNILIQGGASPFGGSESRIGHGAFRLAGGAGSNQDGNILVTAGGSLTHSCINGGGPANIGHGTGQAPPADIPLLSGNIDVQIGTDLIMRTERPQLSIGHFAQIAASFGVSNIEGNIQVVAGRDILLESLPPVVPGGAHIVIGHNAIIATAIGAITPIEMRVAAGRDLTIINNESFCVIGAGWRNVFSSDVLVQMTLDLEVCRDMTLTTNLATNRGIGIGNIAAGTGAGAASTGSFYGSVGGGLSATANGGAIEMSSFGDFNLAVGGSIDLTGLLLDVSIGPAGTSLGDFRMFAGGSILVSHAVPVGTVQFAVNPLSLDFRAGGDIQIPSSVVPGAGQPISYQANHSFASGDLWTTNGAAPFAIATVCGSTTNIGSFALFSNSCATADSPAIASVCGAVSVDPFTPGTLNFTTTGALTITGSCTACSAAPSNATIGPGGDFDFGAVLTSVAIGPFQNIVLNNSFSTMNAISLSACDDLTIQPGINLATTNPNQPITLTADADNNGAGNLTLQGNLTTVGGAINLFAGPLAASGTSSILQTGNTLISSAGGAVTALAFRNITFSGTSPTLMTTAGGALTATALTGSISLDENIATTGGNTIFTAGLDILINPPGGTSVAGGSIAAAAGNLSLFANNNIIVNGDAASLSTTSGNIAAIADFDNTGVGNLIVNRTISSTTGGICAAAGPGTFGCSQNNCHSGLISGFPVGSCTVNIAGGSITSASGSITITSAQDIIVNGLAPSVSTAGPIAMTAGLGDLTVFQQVISTGSSLTTFAGNDTELTQSGVLPLIQAAGEIRMIAGLNMTLNPNTAILSTTPGDQVTLIVDNIHPNDPAFPAAASGSFTMLAGSSVDSGSPLRIFTAYSQVFGSGTGINFIDPTALLNGLNPYSAPYLYPIAPFTDTPYEQWCVFFGCPSNYPFPALGDPFTVFYKICLAQIVFQAVEITTEFLLDLHPYNEFPGWMERFFVKYSSSSPRLNSSIEGLGSEPYFLRRRHLSILNHPKTATVIAQ